MADSTKPAPWLTIFGFVVSAIVLTLYFTATRECGGVPEPPTPVHNFPTHAIVSDLPVFRGFECKNGTWHAKWSGMFGDYSEPYK